MYKSFSAMILGAGFGKRMQPLTHNIPKPLVKINEVSLLKNTIDFLFDIGCQKIIINTHFKHNMIQDFISQHYKYSKIYISYESTILDTGGGVKNAISLFNEENILVTNSDIFWTKENKEDVINFISDFKNYDECSLLLVNEKNANGINKKFGDFILKDNLVQRWTAGEKFYYSGLQFLKLEILNKIKIKKFSFNNVWDLQIKKNSLHGKLMTSDWFHIGDLKALYKLKNIIT